MSSPPPPPPQVSPDGKFYLRLWCWLKGKRSFVGYACLAIAAVLVLAAVTALCYSPG